MKINDTSIFIGAYAERNQNKHPMNTNTATLSVSEEQERAITAGIKEAFYSLNLQNKSMVSA